MVVDLADLENGLLEFRRKSFGFSRLSTVEQVEYAVFRRTETESESRLRPKLLRLTVVVPREWVVYDLTADSLVLAADGSTPGMREAGEAHETAEEASEFSEQGIEFVRLAVGREGFLYLPKEKQKLLGEPGTFAQLSA